MRFYLGRGEREIAVAVGVGFHETRLTYQVIFTVCVGLETGISLHVFVSGGRPRPLMVAFNLWGLRRFAVEEF